MSGFVATARRHPGLSFVGVPSAVLVVAVLALWPNPPNGHQRIAAGVPVLAEQRPAPDFSRSVLTGTGHLSLRQFRGSVVVVNFWASWCAPCRAEAPRLRALARRTPGVVFLGVDEQDTRALGLRFVRQYRPGYRSVLDPTGSLLHAFGSIGVPSTYILDRSGRLRYQAFGPVDTAALGEAIARVAA